MPSPEAPNFNPTPASGESVGETPRQTYQARGETTLRAEHEQRERELLEERAKVMEELQAVRARIASTKQELGIQAAPEGQEQSPTATPENPSTTETPTGTAEPAAPVAPTSGEAPTTTPTGGETPATPATPENPAGSEIPPVSPAPVSPEGNPAQGTTGNTGSTTSGTGAETGTTQGTTGNTSPVAGETGSGDPETQPSPEEIQNTINKAKKNSAFKKVIIGVATVAMAGIMAVGGWLGINALNKNQNQNTEPSRPGIVSVVAEETTTVGENQETKGIYDGYGEKGMWLSDSKGGSYDFASAKETAEACDSDECEMMKYTSRNQVESYADYIANLPEELQPEGFKGLTILEAEKKLEGLSDEDYDAVKQQFDGVIDGAFTRDVTLNGDYHNSYMRLIDPSKPATHDNMELVECTTHENGTKAVEMYWTDDGTAHGKVMGTMTVKISRDGNGSITGGCMQIVNPYGTHSNIYTGMPDIVENPETTPEIPTTPPETTPPTTPPETPPDETIKPKDPDNLTRIDEQILDDIAEDIGSKEVHVTPNSGVSDDDITERPSSDAYQGTSPTIVQNDASRDAEPVQEQVSPENDYSQDRGGAHSDEYAPVQDNPEAQAAADAAEIPIEEAPTSGQELQDVLGDLGIN